MQFNLFEKRPLFDDEALSRREHEWRTHPIERFEEVQKSASDFITEVQLRRRKDAKETALEQEFNRALFRDLLGYSLYPGVEGGWSAWPKPPTAVTGLAGEPDVLLGAFGEDEFKPIVVVELKRPGTRLDAPQPGYGGKTPVEQAFQYARRLSPCRWVLVSDMRFVRLYSAETDSEFHEIDLWTETRPREDILRECWHLLARVNLVEEADDAPTLRLLHASQERQFSFRDGFYRIYSDIRTDLIEEIAQQTPDSDRLEIVQAAQRLLDRLLFIYFCEDHPDRLLARNLLRDLLDSAVRQPGPSRTKAYDALKGLFRDLDEGRNTEFWKVPKYNGELFKSHPILDTISLSDELYSKTYHWTDGRIRRTVKGVYGLHVFDFWRELDRDLLGNVFEKSIGDLEDIALGAGGRRDARAAFGIFYTSSRLAHFAANSAITSILEDNDELQGLIAASSTASAEEARRLAEKILTILKSYRLVDLACGSGVFLTTALDALLTPYRKVLEASAEGALSRELMATRQAEVLRAAIFGDDLLPQAVELAKLALWLTAARKGEPSADLTSNFTNGDALHDEIFEQLKSAAPHGFDAAIGNPPWGGEVGPHANAGFEDALDSWELFLRKAFEIAGPEGRVGLLVPDTFFLPAKTSTRRWLADNATIEKVYLLGPDWFGPSVRMSTVYLQVKKAPPQEGHRIKTLLLAGDERLRAQSGRRPLRQAEESSSGWFLQARCRETSDAKISVLLSEDELPLLDRIVSNSVELESICIRGRGDEISANGLVWRCGNCGNRTVPGEKTKGGGYKDKLCPSCTSSMTANNVEVEALVSTTSDAIFNVPYIDGQALTRRYQNPTRRFIRTDLAISPPLKNASAFEGPKILIRQAGVGITATVVYGNDRFPQSVYTYRPTPAAAAAGYSPEFILACLSSRLMNFYHMKNSGEVEPAKAFSKVTHATLAKLPIPKLDSQTRRRIADEVGLASQEMLALPRYGSDLDYQIERSLQALWGVSADEGRYINGFFSKLPSGQAVRDLFPDGAPTPIPFPSSAAA